MKPAHFYHVFADGSWYPALSSHVQACAEADFAPDLYVGLVGEEFSRNFALSQLPEAQVVAEASAGYEQVTVEALREWALAQPPERPVLYAHTKGAFHNSTWNACWRRSMTQHCVGRWQECICLLSEYDAVGCHWLKPGVYTDLIGREWPVQTPIFGGNFWWATAGYLASLPPLAISLDESARGEAELWLGRGNPRVYDLNPGWMDFDNLGLTTEERAQYPENCIKPFYRP
jgi:hypothetical protein